jgi:hypothetical protein
MTDSHSKKPLTYLEAQGTVHVLWHKLKKMEQLHTVVNKYLDKSMQDYCKVTSFVSGKLTIVAANSSIASQLHFQSAELLQKLKREPALGSVQTIHCKVQPQNKRLHRAQSHSKHIKPLSAKTAKMISDIADGIDDVRLREAMKKLAKNV